jgi:Protein RETICULATA-related
VCTPSTGCVVRAVFQALTLLREVVDPAFVPLNPPQNVLETSLAYGSYMAVSSNLRCGSAASQAAFFSDFAWSLLLHPPRQHQPFSTRPYTQTLKPNTAAVALLGFSLLAHRRGKRFDFVVRLGLPRWCL